MSFKVLVVDDSTFFCRTVQGIIDSQPEFKVVGIANNGREAIDKVVALKPDLVTMDVEMPVMDGITALREIMQVQPTIVIMFSSLTFEGARMTLDALNAGATDFVLKTYTDVAGNHPKAGQQLIEKLKEVSAAKLQTVQQSIQPVVSDKPVRDQSKRLNHPVDIVCIGASTGGPMAIQDVIQALPSNFPAPVLIVQHMPENFTSAYANRLNTMSKLQVVEGQSGQALKAGHVYIAPGGKQMIVTNQGGTNTLKILDKDERVQYQPCVDVTFASVAKVYGRNALGVVLTGMGADGRDGSRLLKERGASVWVQDEATSVVYGMPASVANAGLADSQIPIHELAACLQSGVM